MAAQNGCSSGRPWRPSGSLGCLWPAWPPSRFPAAIVTFQYLLLRTLTRCIIVLRALSLWLHLCLPPDNPVTPLSLSLSLFALSHTPLSFHSIASPSSPSSLFISTAAALPFLAPASALPLLPLNPCLSVHGSTRGPQLHYCITFQDVRLFPLFIPITNHQSDHDQVQSLHHLAILTRPSRLPTLRLLLQPRHSMLLH
jgi:hypothetical protein